MKETFRCVELLIPGLRRYARSLTSDHAAADDLVQDSLERMIAHWRDRRPDGDIRAWVFRILHNLAVDHMRKAARRGIHMLIDEADEAATSQPANQEDALHREDLLRALQKLPVKQRSVLLLISVEDLSYAEAANTLDIPIGTVMSRLSRGRSTLERVIQEDAAAVIRLPRRVK